MRIAARYVRDARRRRQLREPRMDVGADIGTVQRVVQQRDDDVVTAEVREVREREIDGPRDGSGAAEAPELVELASAPGHVSGG
jgi:hypothetical protein